MDRMSGTTLGRAALLAGVTGLRAALGPALITASRRAKGKEALALAAIAEMVVDKLPMTPSRSSLPLLLPRALAGYWVAAQVAEQDRVRDPRIALTGAASAALAALVAPTIRSGVGRAFRVPDPLLGAIEDALAVSVGALAAGLSNDELRALVEDAIGALREGQVAPTIKELGGRLAPTR